MLIDEYRKAVDELFAQIRDTQTEAIHRAGELIAQSIEDGHSIHLSSICHHMEADSYYRGGGPIFYRHFEYKLSVDNPTLRTLDPQVNNIEGLGAYALRASNVRPGDVLIVGSVSGRTASVVDLAYEAKKMGVKVIAFISMKYATSVDAVHSCGKKLYEMADVVLDNCAPAAEAMIEYPGLEARFGAASGIGSDYILWSVTSVAVDILLSHGKTPGILKSANFPGGNDYNKTVVEPNYAKNGY